MFFTLSKLVFFIIQPSTLILLMLTAGIVLLVLGRAVRTGARLALAGLALLAVGGFSPMGSLLVAPLEQRFPAGQLPGPGAPPVAGIILLGGFEDISSDGSGDFGVNESADRLVEGLRLAYALPEAKVVFTGGAAGIFLEATSAADKVARWLADVGVARDRLVIEGASRNTHENAIFTRDLLKPQPGARYLLVTSAWHMPRSMGVFRKAGFHVIAWPVDRRIKTPRDIWRPFDQVSEGLKRLDLAAKEWIGLVAYYVTGRTSALWPGP